MADSRYSRQLSLDEIGPEGQAKLARAKIAIVGCGGLGAIAAAYLAGAGVGHLRLIDGDHTSLSNLHRQVFYSTEDLNRPKVEALAEHLGKLNDGIHIETIHSQLDKESIHSGLDDMDLILECTDDIWCKYLVNDYCHLHNRPMVYGAIHKTEGRWAIFRNSERTGIHLRDIHPTPDGIIPTCAEVGVMNTIAGIVGLMQSSLALTHLIDDPSGPKPTVLHTFDSWSQSFHKVQLEKSFGKDLAVLFEQSEYSDPGCGIEFLLSVPKIKEKKDELRIISVLEEEESNQESWPYERVPLSRLSETSWRFDGRDVLFSCMSGTRAAEAVRIMQDRKTEFPFYYTDLSPDGLLDIMKEGQGRSSTQ